MTSIQGPRHQGLLTQAAFLGLRSGGSDALGRIGRASSSDKSVRKVVVTVVSTGEDPAAQRFASAFKSTVDLYDIPGDVPVILAEKAGELCRSGQATLLDVRQPEQIAMVHFEGAVRIPWLSSGTSVRGSSISSKVNPTFIADVKALIPDKIARIIVACQLGHWRPFATQALRSAEYSNAVCLEGGLHAWSEENLPLH